MIILLFSFSLSSVISGIGATEISVTPGSVFDVKLVDNSSQIAIIIFDSNISNSAFVEVKSSSKKLSFAEIGDSHAFVADQDISIQTTNETAKMTVWILNKDMCRVLHVFRTIQYIFARLSFSTNISNICIFSSLNKSADVELSLISKSREKYDKMASLYVAKPNHDGFHSVLGIPRGYSSINVTSSPFFIYLSSSDDDLKFSYDVQYHEETSLDSSFKCSDESVKYLVNDHFVNASDLNNELLEYDTYFACSTQHVNILFGSFFWSTFAALIIILIIFVFMYNSDKKEEGKKLYN